MAYRDDDVAADQLAAEVAELERRWAKLEADRRAIEEVAREARGRGAARLKRPLTLLALLLAVGGGVICGSKLHRKRVLAADLCAPPTEPERR